MEISDHRDQVLRDFPGLPVSFRAVLGAYLAGEGSLEQVQQERERERQQIHYLDFLLCSLWEQASEHLDAYDCRILDLYLADGNLGGALIAIASSGRVEEAVAYLVSQGMDSEQMLRELVYVEDEALFDYSLNHQSLSGLLRSLLHRLPSDPDQFLRALDAHPFWSAASTPSPFRGSPRSILVSLLLALRPPPLDLAWAVAQSLEHLHLNDLGLCATGLLAADPTRFTPWARHVAGPASPASHASRNMVLQALLKLDISAHLDLALAAAAEPLSDDYWHHCLQVTALSAAYRFDPARAQPLVEEMARHSSHWLGQWAAALLSGAPVEDLSAFFWRCIAEGSVPVALSAFESLQAAWYWRGLIEKRENARKLLTHHAQEIREAASAWLAQHEDVIP